MSFLAQVIATAGEVEMSDIKERIVDTKRNIESLDLEIKEYLDDKYVKFVPLMRGNQLVNKAEFLHVEMSKLRERIKTQTKPALEESVVELQSLTTSLQESNVCLLISKQILDLDNGLEQAEESLERKNYLEAASKLKSIQEALLSPTCILRNLLIYKPLLEHLITMQTKCTKEALKIWKCFFQISDDVNAQGEIMRINIQVNRSYDEYDIVRVLAYQDVIEQEVNSMKKQLYYPLYCRLIDCHSNVFISEMNDIFTLTVESNRRYPKQNATEVIRNLKSVTQFLSESLDIFINDTQTFFNILGSAMESDFCDYFLDNCLSEAVPIKLEEYKNFESVANLSVEMENFFKERGFMSDEQNSISNYTSSLDKLLVEKICLHYLTEARKLFTKDLHSTVQVGPNNNQSPMKSSMSDALEDTDFELCKNMTQFPSCQVSTPIKELLQLIRQILEECAASEEELQAARLFNTARDVVSLYYDLTPIQLKNLLITIPQQSALYYNNCMYLAHKLAGFGIEYATILPNNIATFVDFVEPLRNLGQAALDAQVEIQRKQLVEMLSDSGLKTANYESEFPSSVEKCVRQCLRQLNLLQSVWQHILCDAVYCKTIGSLCGTVIKTLILDVLSIQDISVDTASQLISILTILYTKIPSLYSDANEVHRYIKQWSRYTELLKLLNSSMRDIDDRWADGKGPLAAEFSAEQVKHLIKAIFQPSEIRSALLNKIVQRK